MVVSTRSGLCIQRRFTRAEIPVYRQFSFVRRNVEIRSPLGQIVFSQHDVEVPESWSQLATDIVAQKYFRRTDIPHNGGALGGETSVKQVVHRMVDCWKQWGLRYGYFSSDKDASAFYDELVFMLLDQRAAPNSPQWFNTGLFTAYGIKGSSQGHYHVDPVTNEVGPSASAYEFPQPHACFILSVHDELVNPGGIMDLWMREARIFKYGSGSGSNFSAIRSAGEQLAGGGNSSGLMSFLKIGDAAAAAIRSGGTTRRAAKMVCLDDDHPEILSFIRWKAEEERKARILMQADESADAAYSTVSGQHSNNSVRFSNRFMKALESGDHCKLFGRTDHRVMATLPAKEVWDELCTAAWQCADPGVQFDSTINEWNTCPAGGRINASNPCSEYMFLDDTACNLASLNLLKFMNPQNGRFEVEDFRHACRLLTIALDISVLMAGYPSVEVARNSADYRTIGLGFANLAAYCMANGWPYDDERSRATAAAITALMTGTAYSTSSELAEKLGPFKWFSDNRRQMLDVIHNHASAMEGPDAGFRRLSILPRRIKKEFCEPELFDAARQSLIAAEFEGEIHGFRNAQVTAIAPTGTISLVMDCDTTGIEPDYALIKNKRMIGGGVVHMINKQVRPALSRLGYSVSQVDSMVDYLLSTGHLAGHPELKKEHYEVFACATIDGRGAQPIIGMNGHLFMMAAVQPFLSGAISKTVNLPTHATVADVSACFLQAWKCGIKSITVYREGCKSLQPLTTNGSSMLEEYAPVCPDCGHATIRDGTCFKCPNCASTIGCS